MVGPLGFRTGVVALAVFGAAASPAPAAYIGISGLYSGWNHDMSFHPGTGHLSVVAQLLGAAPSIGLLDPGALPGTVLNPRMELSTYLVEETLDGMWIFGGGDLMFTFDYDADGPGGAPATPHHIGGPIFRLELARIAITPSFIINQGTAYLAVNDLDLPGSGIWPDGGDLSILELPEFPLNAVTNELRFRLAPGGGGVPEPGSLLLIAIGLVAPLRRRRPRSGGI